MPGPLTKPHASLAQGTQHHLKQLPSMIQELAWSWDAAQQVQPLCSGGWEYLIRYIWPDHSSLKAPKQAVWFNVDADLIAVMASKSLVLRRNTDVSDDPLPWKEGGPTSQNHHLKEIPGCKLKLSVRGIFDYIDKSSPEHSYNHTYLPRRQAQCVCQVLLWLCSNYIHSKYS